MIIDLIFTFIDRELEEEIRRSTLKNTTMAPFLNKSKTTQGNKHSDYRFN